MQCYEPFLLFYRKRFIQLLSYPNSVNDENQTSHIQYVRVTNHIFRTIFDQLVSELKDMVEIFVHVNSQKCNAMVDSCLNYSEGRK